MSYFQNQPSDNESDSDNDSKSFTSSKHTEDDDKYSDIEEEEEELDVEAIDKSMIGDEEEDGEDEDDDADSQDGGGAEMDDGNDDDNEDDKNADSDEDAPAPKKSRVKKIPSKQIPQKIVNFSDSDDSDDETGEQYLQKFDKGVNQNYLKDYHPESVLQNYDEILAMSVVTRSPDGIIIDDLHRTLPYLTKYERARILGQRAKQLGKGAIPFVKVPETVIDGYIIAELELKAKRLPFIIRRPLSNGGSEYWKVSDLEDIAF